MFPADCPLDASLVPLLAYLLMNGDEGARDQLRREMAAAGEQMGNTALEGRQHLYYFVIGGGNVVAWGDYLRTYLSILEKSPGARTIPRGRRLIGRRCLVIVYLRDTLVVSP